MVANRNQTDSVSLRTRWRRFWARLKPDRDRPWRFNANRTHCDHGSQEGGNEDQRERIRMFTGPAHIGQERSVGSRFNRVRGWGWRGGRGSREGVTHRLVRSLAQSSTMMVERIRVAGRPELEKCVRMREFGTASIVDRHRQQDERGGDQVPGADVELASTGCVRLDHVMCRSSRGDRWMGRRPPLLRVLSSDDVIQVKSVARRARHHSAFHGTLCCILGWSLPCMEG